MEIGNEKENLTLKTAGKIKVLWGKKFIDLLDKNGNLNIKHLQIIKSAESIDSITSDGIYVIGSDVVISFGGNNITITQQLNEESEELSEDTTSNLEERVEELEKFDLQDISDSLYEVVRFLKKAFPLYVKNVNSNPTYYGFYTDFDLILFDKVLNLGNDPNPSEPTKFPPTPKNPQINGEDDVENEENYIIETIENIVPT